MATLWGRKNFYQSGLFLALLDAYQMGEKFSKSFIKIEFSCSIPWKEKIIRKNFIFFALPCSTPWGDLSEISEAIHKIRVFVLYHLREKNIYGKGAVFDHPRCLPIEERKIKKHPAKWLSPLGISEEKNNSIKAAHFAISRWLLFGGIFESNSRGSLTGEYVKKLWIFRKTPTKTASLSRNKWKANFREDPKKHHLSFLT